MPRCSSDTGAFSSFILLHQTSRYFRSYDEENTKTVWMYNHEVLSSHTHLTKYYRLASDALVRGIHAKMFYVLPWYFYPTIGARLQGRSRQPRVRGRSDPR